LSDERVIPYDKNFARRIWTARQAVSLTQKQLGFHAGVSDRTISAIESGAGYTPSVEMLARLADTLGVQIVITADSLQAAISKGEGPMDAKELKSVLFANLGGSLTGRSLLVQNRSVWDEVRESILTERGVEYAWQKEEISNWLDTTAYPRIVFAEVTK
jgi:transcriptional regulator with XRE-family HTH domain